MSGESFARLLKQHRIAAALSQETLAELSGVSVDAISALERGARRAPYRATLDLLIGALVLDDDARREIEEAATLARARGPQVQREELLSNLPLQLTSFVNREEVVAEIKELLRFHRFVTLVGTGGAGKTRCAIKIGVETLHASDDGVWLAELAPISDPALVADAIARALSLQEAPNRPMLDTLLAYLKRKRLLLIIDNCEHVIDAARHVVASILHSCPGVRILATSRESLAIQGEQAYRIPSLVVPARSAPLSADEMSQYAAVRLFTDRAVSADNRFTLSAASAPHVAEICRRLDGIPLAIELAAARIRVLSPRELAQKLDELFRLLTVGDRSALPRHRTMRAVIDWSYALLSDGESRLFRKLSIFAGDFNLELASAVSSENDADEMVVIDLLSSLIDKSLVQVEQLGSERRYRLLEATRQYARERLVEAGEYATVARAHAIAFLTFAEELDRGWETTPDRVWFDRAERELENFRAALDWALKADGDVLVGQRLAAALRPAWGYLAPAEGQRWVQAARDKIGHETPTYVLAALDFAEASLAATFTQFKASRIAAERAVARYRELSDSLGVAQAQHLVGQSLVFLGDVTAGEALLTETLASARLLGSARLTGHALQGLAFARNSSGDVAAAQPLHTEALAIFQAAGAERSAAVVSANLGEAAFQAGDPAEALRLASESFAAYRPFNDARNAALSLCNMACYLTALERYDEAHETSHAALATARDAQYEICVSWVLQHLAAIAALQPIEDAEQGRANGLRAARLLGYVDAHLGALGVLREYPEQRERDRILAALRDSLGEDHVSVLMLDGSTWTEDQAVAEAMFI